jgi:hypothetical protein
VAVVGRSPLLLVTGFAGTLALWGTFAGLGVLLAASPGLMALLAAVPPVHAFFVDVQVLVSGPGRSLPVLAAAGLVLMTLRALLLGLWVGRIRDALEKEAPSGASGASGKAPAGPPAFRAETPDGGPSAASDGGPSAASDGGPGAASDARSGPAPDDGSGSARDPEPGSVASRRRGRPLRRTGNQPSPFLWASRQALRSFRVLFGLEAASLGLAVVSLFAGTLLGAGLGQLAALAGLFAGTYFFVLSPVVAVVEGSGFWDSLRSSVAAARVPGPRHMLLTFTYLALCMLVPTLTPGSRVAQATPSVAVWAYVLLATFVHLSVLGAYTHRWLAVRPSMAPAAGKAPAG